jgi:putative transposase
MLDSRFKEVYAQVLVDVVRRVDKTYKDFFRRMKNGEKAGYPRFKPARRYDSFTYPQAYAQGYKLFDSRISLTKIGSVRIKLHRPIEGRPKTIVIHRQADGWYAIFNCEVEPRILPASSLPVGVDLGLEFFATTSDGETFPCPKYLKKAEKTIQRLHKKTDRRKKDSNRRKKAVSQLARAYLHVVDQRKDTAHKVARSLVDRYGVIAVENLNIEAMKRNRCLAGAISDAGWSVFTKILSSKAEEAGRQVVKVDPRNTSQICSQCGSLVRKPLSQRWHSCPHCGLELHRDVNAARNILQRAVA